MVMHPSAWKNSQPAGAGSVQMLYMYFLLYTTNGGKYLPTADTQNNTEYIGLPPFQLIK